MRRLTCIQIALIVSATGAPAAGLGQITTGYDPSQITAAGTGEAHASPDRAVIQIGIEVQETSASAAASANAALVAAVMDTLRSLGFPAESLPMVAYGVTPIYDRSAGTRTLSGYNAHASIRITINELNRLGGILDAALAAGANDVPHIQFEASDEAVARRAALTEAVAQARADAAVLAAAAGGRLGKLIELSTVGGGGGTVMMRAARAGELTITPPDVVIRASVTGRWEFLPN
jgi:uncharacterized protein YggE